MIFAGREDVAPFALEPVKKRKTAGETGRKTRRRHVDVVDQKRQDRKVCQGVDPVNQKHENCVEYCGHQRMRYADSLKRIEIQYILGVHKNLYQDCGCLRISSLSTGECSRTSLSTIAASGDSSTSSDSRTNISALKEGFSTDGGKVELIINKKRKRKT